MHELQNEAGTDPGDVKWAKKVFKPKSPNVPPFAYYQRCCLHALNLVILSNLSYLRNKTDTKHDGQLP